MGAPKLSVVVPTHDRPDLLARLLGALASQTVGSATFETVVVDDGSRTPVGDLSRLRSEVRVLRHEHSRGPAAARNTGWQAAQGDLIAFTDDDCRPSPRWLEALLEAWNGEEARIVQGRTEPDQQGEAHPLGRTMEISGPTGLYETCNIAYPRRLLEGTGGFDERFRRACGEDVDLGMRASRAGAELAFAPKALVHHAVHHPPLSALVRHARIWSDAVLTLKLHPELRPMLVGGVFWKRTHPLLLLAGAGAVLSITRRSPLPALLSSAAYLEHYRRVYAAAGESWLEAARRLPVHALIDAVEVATMIEGSARHRTLML